MRRSQLVQRKVSLAVLPAVALLAIGLASCSVRATPHSSASTGERASVTSATFVQTAATAKVSYPEANASLVPLVAVTNGVGTTETVTAKSDPATLVSVSQAFTGIRSGISRLTAGDLAGPIVGSLYSYYNSAYGQIMPNGTVKLKYQGTPVWMFRAPLTHSLNDSQAGPLANGSPRPAEKRTGCSYIVIVDAKSGIVMTWWQHCTGS